MSGTILSTGDSGFQRSQAPAGGGPPGSGGIRGPSTVKEGRRTMETAIGGMDAGQIKSWQDIFLPHKNLATNTDVAKRALNYVRQIKLNYWSYTYRIRKKWKVLNWLLKGHSLSRMDDPYAVHVPEMHNSLETVIPRLEDAVFDDPRWFEAEGRDDGDRKRAEKIRAYMTYQLGRLNWEELVPQIYRAMRVYGFCALKNWWEVEVDHRVKMNPSSKIVDGRRKFEFDIKEEEEIVFNGPKAYVVDPYGFLVDTRNADAQQGAFMGDQQEWWYDDVARIGEMGVWENWKEVRDQPPEEDSLWNTYLKQARAITDEWYLGADQRDVDGAPHRVYITEIWGKFDIFNSGRTRECVITVANDRTVLQVRENPHIDKHRPYAIGRTYTDPWEFHGIAPMDYAIPLQMELDEYRNLGLEGGKLSICPLLFVGEDSTLPDSLWGIRPGSVLRVDSDNPPVPFEIKSVIPEMAGMETILKDDLRTTLKAPTILSGAEADPTATGAMTRVQEANKQLRGEVRAFSKLAQQLLSHMHTMNRMYISEAQLFKTLGTFGIDLPDYSWVGPEDFNWEIDFKFKALANLKMAGSRASNLKEYLQTAAPFIQGAPGAINIPAMLEELWNEIVGRRPGKELIIVPQDPRDLVPQYKETLIMRGGNAVEINQADNHEEHFDELLEYMRTEEGRDEDDTVQALLMEHAQAHAHAQSVAENQEASAKRPQQGFPVGQTAYPGQGSMPANGQQGGAPLEGQQPGVTPGPSNMQRMSTPGRDSATPQDQNLPR